MTVIQAERYHDFSTGHRVYQHESKCAHLHGHNYRIHFTIEAPSLDAIGRVIDFSVIKDLLCVWLEQNWDHKFLVWERDPWSTQLKELDPDGTVIVPFNPTAENMGEYLIKWVGPRALDGTGVTLVKVKIEETRKCSVNVTVA
jgi:6-pyruvoyltetrahydropterin/6-carboxytetrahydropterin synthase